MSNPFKVIDIERNLFKGHRAFILPKTTNEPEMWLRRELGPGSGARRAEHLGLLRFMNMLKIIPVTEIRTLKLLTQYGSKSLIGAGTLGLFPDETAGLESDSDGARMRKPAGLPDLKSRDIWDPSQRPTSNDIIDLTIDKLGVAAAMAEGLIDYGSKSADEIRQRTIDLGRLEAGIGMDLACWQLADQLAYGDSFPSGFDTMHLAREQGIAQKKGAVALAGQMQVIPTVRGWAVPYGGTLEPMYTAGIPALSHALQATAHLNVPA